MSNRSRSPADTLKQSPSGIQFGSRQQTRRLLHIGNRIFGRVAVFMRLSHY